MSDKTGIEWTDATWNPIRGCSRVSEGCRNCYAERTAAFRLAGGGRPYEGLAIIKNGEPHWTGKIMFVEQRLLDPLNWRKPRRIFVDSMSDMFHEGVTDEMLDKSFAVMALCPQHTFQVLTKRPKSMHRYLNDEFVSHRITMAICALIKEGPVLVSHAANRYSDWLEDNFRSGCGFIRKWPLPHVWLGVSVENQAAADERIPLLLQTPAAVRFISAEPLLGPVDLTGLYLPAKNDFIGHEGFVDAFSFREDGEPGLNWVICGGESGPGARPMKAAWVRSLRDQCVAAGVPFFFKQWGEYLPAMTEGPMLNVAAGQCEQVINRSDEPVRVGKHAAGALLDGQGWKQFPEVQL